MAKINILPAKVYNRIAAGEVVDRPYSVVKELVENAVDAGATEIEISIEKGGKQLIRVVDNGCGIARDDLQSAFLPHATSKIAKAEDLDSILTLGFRGEAVASISAVSQMTITSKTEDGECYSLSCNGGEMGEIVQAAGDNGTDVKVEMLFFNTPVRREFMKSDRAEETDITNCVSRFILNRPNIAFTYYTDGKKVLQSFGGGEEEAIVGVYGPSILQNCYQIHAEKHGIKIRGYIGNQNFSKPNKSYQSVFLNGRHVVNATISAAISGAYNAYLMKRQYPFYVLYIDVPTQIVDVNVHPNKSDVRFADNQMIYGIIYSVISAVLDGQSKAMEYIVPSKFTAEPAPTKTAKSVAVDLPFAEVANGDGEADGEDAAPIRSKIGYKSTLLDETPKSSPVLMEVDKKISADMGSDDLTKIPGVELPAAEMEEKVSMVGRKGFIPKEEIPEYVGELVTEEEQRARGLFRKCDRIAAAEQLKRTKFPNSHFEPTVLRFESSEKKQDAPTAAPDVFEENKRYLEQLEKENGATRIEVKDCRYVGKLFNTYLIYEREDDVFIIDQHAAHERLIFDKLRRQMESRTVAKQPMLLPHELKLNAFEAAFIEERMDDIIALGFDIAKGENGSFFISSVPIDLQSIKIEVFFNEILGDISGFRAIKLADLLKDKLAMAACKAAVKGGMDITQDEIDMLFQMIDGNMGLKCPHGRPVVTKITRTELEKMFKRKL